MPFVKGQSGNPAGRPKGYKEFTERCRKWADTEGWKILIELARTADKKTRYMATTYLIDRGYGKATEHHKVESATLEEILERTYTKEKK